MLELKTLKVMGFRAYTEEKTFTFDTPAVLLFGENHCGKSSTLNAIEWCLFGGACIGTETGIRERKEWEIPNRSIKPLQAQVEIQLEDKTIGDKFVIMRKWIGARRDELMVVLPNGQPIKDKEAEAKLAQLIKSSFRDFLTTVYQHQEAIRSILTQEPRERNDAIDRLLGLSDYRNIIAGIEEAKLRRKQKKMVDDFDGFTREIDVALRTRESDLKDKKETAGAKGLTEYSFSDKGALEVAGKVKDQLYQFASETGLSLTDLRIPEQWQKLSSFENAVDGEIRRFRSEMPDVKEQQSLHERRVKVMVLKTKYEEIKETLNNTRNRSENFTRESGDDESLNKKKATTEKQLAERKKQLSEANAKAAAINASIDCLKNKVEDKNICPVCGKETPDLLGHLEREWKEKFEADVGTLQNQIEVLQTELKKIEELQKEFNKLKKDLEDANKKVGEVNKEVSNLLGREVTAEDDCSAILNGELDEINRNLQKLELAVKNKQRTLDEMFSLLEQIRLIVDILTLEQKKKIVERIQQSAEYLRMEKLKDQMAVLIDNVEKIKQAVSEASHVAVEQKVAAAGKMIDGYFRRIANNPSVAKIDLCLNVDSRTGLNSYAFTDQNGKDLIPVLSQGDLNAMALSIFLAMAVTEGTIQPFGFVMLDDPSQSLGSEHKEKLIEVLNEVIGERMVILSSMDRELQQIALSKISKTKAKYIFSDWTPKGGPVVSRA